MHETDDRQGASFYTLDELQEQSGFDRRTIAYYVQMKLLPGVGRRGRRTRYPKTFLDRLLVIRRLRDLEENGEINPLNLSEMRLILDQLSEQMIEDLASGKEPLQAIDFRFDSKPVDSPPIPGSVYAMESSSHPEHSRDFAHNFESNFSKKSTHEKSDKVSQLLSELEQQTGKDKNSNDPAPQQWTRMEITPNIAISIRNLNEAGISKLKLLTSLLHKAINKSADK
ncbi:MAG: MerR family transcriptional regulator [bacterium]